MILICTQGRHERHDNYSCSSSGNKVISILLIYERAGTVSEVLRYPITTNNNCFFTSLPSRLIEKLFRPHPSLCRQPMTITFQNTIFCSRSIISQDCATTPCTPSNELASNASNSVLFSVVVALASSASIPRSLEEDEFIIIRRRNLAVAAATKTTNSDSVDNKPSTYSNYYTSRSDFTGKSNSTSTRSSTHAGSSVCSLESAAVQRVHMSLSRLCTMLEREQSRCGYVSIQCNALLKIRDEVLEKQRQQMQLIQEKNDKWVEENKQATLELMLAADMQQLAQEQDIPPAMAQMQHGNLARDLVATFHALSRNCCANFIDSRCNDNIVYVNGHLAVPIEPIFSNADCESQGTGCVAFTQASR